MGLLRTEFKPSTVQYFRYAKSQSIFGFKFAEHAVTFPDILQSMQIHMPSHSKTHEETFNASNLLPSIIQFNFLSICQRLISTFPTRQATRIIPQLLQCFP